MYGMKANWEKCSGPRSRQEPGPKVCISLNRAGDITLNAAAFYLMANITHAALYYDREKQLIGIHFCYGDDPDILYLYKRKDKKFPRVLRARRLLKQFGIEITETIRFLPPTREKDDLFILDLKTAYVPEQVKRHYRNKRRMEAKRSK